MNRRGLAAIIVAMLRAVPIVLLVLAAPVAAFPVPNDGTPVSVEGFIFTRHLEGRKPERFTFAATES